MPLACFLQISRPFLDGLILGAVIGAGAFYLFGTASGKKIVKIIQEKGLDGLAEVLEEYDLKGLVDFEEEEVKPAHRSHTHESDVPNKRLIVHDLAEIAVEEIKPLKKRFFKRYN